MESICGFQEIPHTADWALHVWAPDLSHLLQAAALGMYKMMETRLSDTPRIERGLALSAPDAESLLVVFLGELLFMAEEEGVGFDQIDLALDGLQLCARLQGASIAGQSKLIKAVTYHKLKILPTAVGFETTIVFDV